MMNLLRRLAAEESGQDIIEYALLAAGIATIMIPIVPIVGQTLVTLYTNINGKVGSIAP